jgi:hypothetical protein
MKLKNNWNWGFILVMSSLALFWFILILGITSCDTKETLVLEKIPYKDTITITMPHYNLGSFCFPSETQTFIEQDTLYLEYYR